MATTEQATQYTAVPQLDKGQATTATAGQATAATTGPTNTSSAVKANATNANASYWGVGDKQTVQGQVKGIIDADSPLMQQAATTAKQGMASRGLVNSSMAVGAGQNAVIGAAMPMAQQDAATFAQAHQQNAVLGTDVSKFNAANATDVSKFNAATGTNNNQFNADAKNTDQRFNAQNATQNSQFNTQLGAQNSQFNAQAKNDMTQFNISAEASMLKQGMDADTRVNLANIEANYQTLMQSTQSAGSLYSQMLTNISNIQNNKDMDAAAKNAAVAAQYAYLENGMNLIAGMNNLDIGDLLKFDTPPPPTPPGAPAPPPGAPPPGTPGKPDYPPGWRPGYPGEEPPVGGA